MAKLKLVKKDKKDTEIDILKKQLMELTKKYLKKRKKETKDKGKYKKIKDRINKRTGLAQSQSDIQKLIAMLSRGVSSGTSQQPYIQQTPATTGTISSRISTDKKKTTPQDPIKLWRELKKNWSDIKDKYKSNTITREDIVNIWNKAKKLATAVQDNSLLLVGEIVAMYGVGKAAYEYLMRFINKHKPSTENPANVDDDTSGGPSPPPSGGGGGGGGGGGDDKPPPPSTPSPSTPQEVIVGEQRGDGLGRFSDVRARDISKDPREGSSSGQTWTEYLKASMPSLVESAVATGLGVAIAGGMYGQHRLGIQKSFEEGRDIGAIEGYQVAHSDIYQNPLHEPPAMRMRGRETFARGEFGEAVRNAEGVDIVAPPVGLEAVRGGGIGGGIGGDGGSQRPQISQDTAYTQGSMPSQPRDPAQLSVPEYLALSDSQQMNLID